MNAVALGPEFPALHLAEVDENDQESGGHPECNVLAEQYPPRECGDHWDQAREERDPDWRVPVEQAEEGHGGDDGRATAITPMAFTRSPSRLLTPTNGAMRVETRIGASSRNA